MTTRHIRYVGASLEAFRNHLRLLRGRPSAPALTSGNHLNASISVTFIAGIKHGWCHRVLCPYQRGAANIARNPCAREGERSNRLRWTFGTLYLADGLPLVPVVLGIFALPEL